MISIIIPVYNVEKYLLKCLESIANQNFKDFETILIDDGSTDNSPEICKNFCQNDGRFKYFRQENSGVSTARNYGLQKASKKWIAFIDSDDYVGKDYLQLLISAGEKGELVVGGYIQENMHERKEFSIPKSGIIDRFEANKYLVNEAGFYSFLWNKLFLREVIQNSAITFNPNLFYGEDLVFIFEYLKKIDYVQMIPMTNYIYCRHDSSIGGKLTKEKIQRKLTYIDALIYVVSNLEDFEKETKKTIMRKIGLNSVIYRANLIQFDFEKSVIKKFTKKTSQYRKLDLLFFSPIKERLKIIALYFFPLKLAKYTQF